MSDAKTAAMILAAGFSSRMGRLKALLPWKGMTLIEYQIKQMLLAGIEDVTVVLGHRANEIEEILPSGGIRKVRNPQYQEGKSSSIRTGITHIPAEAQSILITAVDQPVPARTLHIMLQHLLSSGAVAVIPTYEEKGGHPIIFSSEAREALTDVREETEGLRHVIKIYKDQVEWLPVDDPSVLFNFNKPEDYSKISQEVSNESIRD